MNPTLLMPIGGKASLPVVPAAHQEVSLFHTRGIYNEMSERPARKSFEDRVTEKPRELVARIAVTEQSKHNNINQG